MVITLEIYADHCKVSLNGREHSIHTSLESALATMRALAKERSPHL